MFNNLSNSLYIHIHSKTHSPGMEFWVNKFFLKAILLTTEVLSHLIIKLPSVQLCWTWVNTSVVNKIALTHVQHNCTDGNLIIRWDCSITDINFMRSEMESERTWNEINIAQSPAKYYQYFTHHISISISNQFMLTFFTMDNTKVKFNAINQIIIKTLT